MSSQAVFIVNDPSLVKSLYPSDNGDTLAQPQSKNIQIVSLPHPKFTIEAKYILLDGKILEIQQVSHPEPQFSPRAWFIGESVDSNGSFYMCTPIDPIFLTLPHLVKACGGIGSDSRYVDLDSCFLVNTPGSEAQKPLYDYFMAMAAPAREEMLQRVATKVETAGLTSYRICTNKLNQWLQKKVSRLAAAIANDESLVPMSLKKTDGERWTPSDFGLTSWSADATYVFSLALEMISDYLSSDVFDGVLATYTDDKGDKFGMDHLLAVSKAKGGRVTADREITNEENGKRKAADQPGGKTKSSKAQPADPKAGIFRFLVKK